jgi:transcriptional regulator with XRE-family HTH domain
MPKKKDAATSARPETPATRVAAPDVPLATGSGAPEVVARSLEQVIGARVRDARKVAGLTLSELAKAADISTALLSRIETGQISPSLNTLQMLSAAINIPLSALLASFEESRGCSYVKDNQGVTISRRGTRAGHQYVMLGQPLPGPIAVEPYLIVLDTSAEPYTRFRHAGIEYLYMLTGEVDYLHGDRSYPLAPGDSLMFDSAEFHGPERLKKLPATYLSIIIYPRS